MWILRSGSYVLAVSVLPFCGGGVGGGGVPPPPPRGFSPRGFPPHRLAAAVAHRGRLDCQAMRSWTAPPPPSPSTYSTAPYGEACASTRTTVRSTDYSTGVQYQALISLPRPARGRHVIHPRPGYIQYSILSAVSSAGLRSGWKPADSSYFLQCLGRIALTRRCRERERGFRPRVSSLAYFYSRPSIIAYWFTTDARKV